MGGLSYLFDVTTLALLHSVLGVSLAAATTVAFAATMGVNFGLNRAFAFRSRSLAGSAFAKYLLLVGLNYLTTLILVTGLAAAGLSYVLAKTLATGLNAVCNYIAYRYWVFRN